MAIGQISGPLLKSNLERNGVNLSVETDLLYIDVVNGRIGVKTSSPQSEIDVSGNVNADSVSVDSILVNNNVIESAIDLTLTTSNSSNIVNIQRDLNVATSLIVGSDITLTSGNLFGPANTVINPAPYIDNTGEVSINGNLTVNGATTTINSETVEIADKNIVIGSGSGDRSFADGAGITVDLGTDGFATLTYSSIDDSFLFNKPLILDSGITIEGQDTTINDLILSGSIQGPSVLLIDPATHGDNTGTVSIAGDFIVSGQSSTLNDLTVGNIETSGYLRGPTSFIIDPLSYGDNTGLVDVLGELTVNGTTTTVNDLSTANITSSGTLTGPALFDIIPYTGTATPGLVTIAGNLELTGDSLTIAGTMYGAANTIIDPAPYNDPAGTVTLNGDLVVNGSSTTLSAVHTTGNISTDGRIHGPSMFIIDPAVHGDNTGTVNIYGDLTVSGATTAVNNLSAADVTINGDLSVPSAFAISPASSGVITLNGDLAVVGDTLSIAGSLLGPSTLVLDPETHNDNTGTVQVKGDLVVDGSSATLNELSVGNITTTGHIRGPATLVLDPHIYDVELGLVEVEGDLTVKGNNTIVKDISTADITTSGSLFGPANFVIDPAAHGDNSGTVSVLGAVSVGDTLSVTNNASVGTLDSGNITTTGHLRGPTSFIIDPETHGDNSGTVSISGDFVVNGSSSTFNDLAVSNITASGYLRGPGTFTIDPATHGDDTGTVVIAGNLQVNAGTVTASSSSFDNLTLTGNLNGPSTFIIDPATHGDNTGVVNIYGDLTVSGNTTTLNDVVADNITTSGYLRGPTTFTIDPATWGDNSGTVVIAGNLQVDGVTTTINSTTVSIDDKLVVVASGSTDKNVATGAGLQVDLGTDGTANLTYTGVTDSFKVDKGFETNGDLRVHNASGQDSIVLKGSGSGTSNYAVEVQSSPLTANRSLTLPNANVTLVSGTMVPTARTLTVSTNDGITGGQPAQSLADSRSWTLGLTGQALALHNFAETGLMVRTGASAFSARSVSVSGIGLSIANANGIAGNPTITSNATHANTPNAIVSRDASGNFSAGTITAALNGNATTSSRLSTPVAINGVSFDGSAGITVTANTSNALTRGSYITGGSASFNGSVASTWSVDATSANTANKVVARDASGNFSAGTITAALNGNATTSTSLQTARTINGVSFDGTANITITANTPNVLSRGTYLTGLSFNGSQTTTWSVDATSANTANKVVARDASGNFSAGTITAALESTGHLLPDTDNTYNLGSSSQRWNTVYGETFTGTSTTAKYADLAEKYIGDKKYNPGTVLIFGGEYEVTTTTIKGDRRVAGVVSTNPAYTMNNDIYGVEVATVALQGKVPCKVLGKVEKGDLIVSSSTPGFAIVDNDPKVGTVIGKALENKDVQDAAMVMIVVGRD